MTQTPPGARDYAMLLTLSAIWGSSFLFIKIGVETIPPITLTALRLISAALILIAAAKIAGERIPAGRGLWGIFALAAFFGTGTKLVDSAEQTASTVEDELRRRDALSPRTIGGRLRCYVSDNPQRFQVIGTRFLGEPITNVAWIAPEQFLPAEKPAATT